MPTLACRRRHTSVSSLASVGVSGMSRRTAVGCRPQQRTVAWDYRRWSAQLFGPKRIQQRLRPDRCGLMWTNVDQVLSPAPQGASDSDSLADSSSTDDEARIIDCISSYDN